MKKPARRGRRGFVLVVALGALAVMTLLLLALLRGASHQTRGAESDAVVAREKMLADSVAALVIGQIAQASTQPGQAWISQPGLLRTYDATTARHLTACYKLYSAASMIDTSGNVGFLARDIPADWNSTANENLYTDLNQSQQSGGFFGAAHYPILDPAALSNVQGLSSDAPHEVEMPVMWLYELQDGSLGPAANGTAANPIVGRVAFWTDDETSKIDLNTAGAGDTWNTPRANSTDDVAFSTTAPAIGEFSRYPGHPAMTSLFPVFGQGSAPFSAQQLLALAPRYAFGGSQFGTLATTIGETVAPETNRLYASVDELAFGPTVANGQRQASAVTPAQVDQDRFVLTVHSESPETTLLGEPRFAIWPVSSSSADTTLTTPADRALAAAATVGARAYFFQRTNPLSSTADLASTTAGGPSNTHMLTDLVARGALALPGYATAFNQKYPGAQWPQLMLELVDFIRGLNAVDPSPAPFVPFAAGNSFGLGRGFIVPLTWTDPATEANLRGLGRCPTLSSLTLVIYNCGCVLDDGTVIDFDTTPDDLAGTIWNANFNLRSPTNRWPHIVSARLRAFVVPVTFQPGCAFPEVSDACDLQITGLDGLRISGNSANGSFGFPASVNSPLLGTAPRVLNPDRAWGGNEGPIAWRLTGDALADGGAATYPFAGTTAFTLPLLSPPHYDARTHTLSWPNPLPPITVSALSNLTVKVRDQTGQTLQTLTVSFPGFTVSAPTIDDECDHYDGSTPATALSNWATKPSHSVFPSYYMSLSHRLLATQNSRPLMIQPGDVTRGIEAGTDLRVVAALSSVPATMFQGLPNYPNPLAPMVHNFRFADGLSAYGAAGWNNLVARAIYPETQAPAVTGTNWGNGRPGTRLPASWYTSATCSAPTQASEGSAVTMSPVQNVVGDWDTGPGFEPDGALINLPDAGTSLNAASAYFSLGSGQPGAATRFAPNALVPSPVIFGSLPAGINPAAPVLSEPWRTLLFCPHPAADTAHPGFATPPDYLLLDNFWMPVVEPYALGTVMASAGKINLNDQIAPFTYLHRNTAFHALLHDLRIPAIAENLALQYKTAGPPITSIWQPVDENATIAQIESRFATGDAYLAESEICSVPLVPQGQSAASLDAFWNSLTGAGRLTGDNLRELPYAQLYGRLTTRSNSYTVHLRVQVLKKLPRDPQQNVWNEGTDLVLGDWRGSYEIERNLDPAASAPAAGQPLGPYRFRIVNSRRFAP